MNDQISNHYNSLCIWLMAEPFDALRIEEEEFVIKVFFNIPQGHWGNPECREWCKTLNINFDFYTQIEVNDENSEEVVIFRKFKS